MPELATPRPAMPGSAMSEQIMPELNASIKGLAMPPEIARLPIDARGWPIPWFVDAPNGIPDHRVVDGRKFARAVRERRCWLCGGKLGRVKASVLGPMCAITRTVSEPPGHPQCAKFAIAGCPFLSKPRARRNEKNLPEERRDPAGMALDRNPGVAALWESLSQSKPFNPIHGTHGTLFEVGPLYRISWWCEGRPATRAEVIASLRGGLPALVDAARLDGEEGLAALSEAVSRVYPLLPAEEAHAHG